MLVGTINLPQQGYDCTLTMQGGVGYNGDLSQNGYVVLKMRTSNGTGYSAHYERYGRNGKKTCRDKKYQIFRGQTKILKPSPLSHLAGGF